ncbi:MAG: ABC transporter ATP-binding protein [Desulfurobacteriaceae bacterium]
MAFLAVRNLTVKREGRTVLSELNFKVDRGEKILIVGENGAGKTTFLEALLGFVKAAKGEILFKGKALKEEEDFREARKKIGYVFQNPDDQLFSPTVEEELAFAPLVLGFEREKVKRLVEKYLKLFGLEKLRNKPTFKLSGGEKRLVSIACVLTQEPELLLLDEPTTGLDRGNFKKVTEILRSVDCSVITVTHDTKLIETLNWKIYKLEKGRLRPAAHSLSEK